MTSVENNAPLCAGDHGGKTIGAFELRHLGEGVFQWTTPSGHQYLRHRDGRVTPLARDIRTEATAGELAAAGARATWYDDEPPF